MDDQKAHIRDWMQMTPKDLSEGRVTGKTLCGLEDPDHNKLTFAHHDAVASGTIRGPCEKCRKIWISEYQGSDHRNARRKFREIISELYSGRRFVPKNNKRLLIKK